MKTIRFKSTPSNWWKEYIGLKCNTIRELDGGIRFELLSEFIIQPFALNIEIENTKTGDIFTRKVSDVTLFGFYIISWKQEGI